MQDRALSFAALSALPITQRSRFLGFKCVRGGIVMSKILIVDDEKLIRDRLVEIARDVNPNVDVLNAGTVVESLRIARENDIKVFFLDIRLAGTEDGIELAKEIRKIKKYEFTMIVFVTSMADRRLEAFMDIHCYDFLVKDLLNDDELRESMRKMLVEYMKKDDKGKIVMDVSYGQIHLKYEDIIYLEYNDRNVYIQTFSERIECENESLKQMVKNFANCFIQISKNVVVNMNNVDMVNKKKRVIIFRDFDEEKEYTRLYKKRVERYEHESI
jgi:DNA-binding LytR/AlgR family response regulator